MNSPESGYFPIPDENRYWKVRQKLQNTVCKMGLRVEGAEHLDNLAQNDSENGVIVASTHTSWIDIVALGAINDKVPMRFLGKQEVWKVPYIGKLAVDAGAYSVDRNNSDSRRAALDLTKDMLDHGEWVTMYLEGTRNKSKDRKSIGKPKTGVARAAMAVEGETAILPVAIGYNKGLFRRKASPINVGVVVGEPIFVGQDVGAQRQDVEFLTDHIASTLRYLKSHAVDVAESSIE